VSPLVRPEIVYSVNTLTETDVEPGADHLQRFRKLPLKRRIVVLLCALFLAWHATVTLIWGAGDRVRGYVKPALAWYAEGLKLAGSWGMFAAPGRMHVVYVYGVTDGHERVLLSPDPNSSLYKSMVDMRERKMRSRLGDKEQRDYWGTLYLEGFCQSSQGDWFQRVELEMAEHDEQHRWGKRSVVLTRTCFLAKRTAEKAGLGQKAGHAQKEGQ
jgi:hypothetical protein